MSETSIVTAVKKHLEANGFFVLKIHGSALQRAGIPDLLAIRDGHAHWFEVKRPGGELTRLQAYWLDQLSKIYGCTAGVVRSVEDVQRVIK